MAIYQVVGECAHVTELTALGKTVVLRYKGATVSPDAPELKHLLDQKLVAKVGDDETGGVNADGVTLAEARGDVHPSGALPPAEEDDRRSPAEVLTAATAATTAFSDEPSAEEKAAAELTETNERRQAAREKLAKLDGKAPDGRHHEDVLVEYLVAQGGNYDDLVRAEKSDLVEMVKSRQS